MDIYLYCRCIVICMWIHSTCTDTLSHVNIQPFARDTWPVIIFELRLSSVNSTDSVRLTWKCHWRHWILRGFPFAWLSSINHTTKSWFRPLGHVLNYFRVCINSLRVDVSGKKVELENILRLSFLKYNFKIPFPSLFAFSRFFPTNDYVRF